jgi:cell shape-determining protein MreC
MTGVLSLPSNNVSLTDWFDSHKENVTEFGVLALEIEALKSEMSQVQSKSAFIHF